MSSFRSNPGSSGVTGIVLGLIGVGVLITVTTGSYIHWVPLALSIVVGLWAVDAINS